MTDQHDTQSAEKLDDVSDELVRGLERCHTIVHDYRAKLAADRNERGAANEDDGEDEDGPLG